MRGLDQAREKKAESSSRRRKQSKVQGEENGVKIREKKAELSPGRRRRG